MEPGTRRAPAARWRRFPVTVFLSSLVFLTLGVSHTLVNPAYQSPDELAHFDLVQDLVELEGWPGVRGETIDVSVLEGRRNVRWSKDAYRRMADQAPARGDRPTLEELPEGETSEVNHITQHPPLYYVATATATSTVGIPLFTFVAPRHDRVLAIERMVNVVALAALPLLAAAAVRALGGGRRRQVAAAIAMLAVPQLIYISSSVNNDNLLVLAFATLTLGLCHVLAGRSTWRWALVIGMSAAAAMLSKAFGMLAPAWIFLVYVTVWARQTGVPRRAVARHGVFAMLIAGVIGGVWWLRNLVVEGSLMPAGLVFDVAPRDFDSSFLGWLRGYAPRVLRSFWGHFGYLDVPIPLVIVIVMSVIAVALVGVSVAQAVRTRGGNRLLLLVPLALLALIIGADNYLRAYPDLYGRFTGAQGRYYFAAILPAVVLFANDFPRLGNSSVRALWAGVIAIQAVGLVVLLNAFYGDGLVGVVAWSPWPTPLTIAALVALPASAVALTMALWAPGELAGERR